MFKTIANSVALEQAFSAMNLIITKLQNRLGSKKANKLIFIYCDGRYKMLFEEGSFVDCNYRRY
jgi:citrate lyase synthetase